MLYREISEYRTTLPLRKGVLAQADGLVAVMSPLDFLRLTTPHDVAIDSIIKDRFTSLSAYNDKTAVHPGGDEGFFHKSMYNMPFLWVLYPSGRVASHEGRHRAAMVAKAGGKWFPVNLQFRSDYRYVVQYQETNYDIDPDWSEDKVEVFDDIETASRREKALQQLNRNYDQPYSYSSVRFRTVGGVSLARNPEKRAWQPADMPPRLIGQFNKKVTVSAADMRLGVVKP